MKNFIKSNLPKNLVKPLSEIKVSIELLASYWYDFKKYRKYSDTINRNDREKLIGSIIRLYHVLEKGLTMPETRLGFGKPLVFELSENIENFVHLYGLSDSQVVHSVRVLNEYCIFHEKRGHFLDEDIVDKIQAIKELTGQYQSSQQIEIKKDEYQSFIDSNFKDFSESRKSIRKFSAAPLDKNLLMKSVDLARNAPSACNRQAWFARIVEKSDELTSILQLQGGNRGFGELIQSVVIITGDLSRFTGPHERNQAYIDGGIFAMNLLYALHYHGVGACILNASNSPLKDQRMRSLITIKNNEVFIAIVACGNVPDTLSVALSPRRELAEILID